MEEGQSSFAACLGALEKRNTGIFEDYLEAGADEFWDRARVLSTCWVSTGLLKTTAYLLSC